MPTQRKALVVGINYYEHHLSLKGCVNDANAFHETIERHGNDEKNFTVKKYLGTKESPITRRLLKEKVEELFKFDNEIALLYFSGHGHIEDTGGYLATSEVMDGDEGLSMSELLHLANSSKARNKVVILDCCHSGTFGNVMGSNETALISKGVTILTASASNQYAGEKEGSGVFTSLLVDALNGAATDLLGRITLGSIYAHIDQSLGDWSQRPIFKTNVSEFTVLKQVVQQSITLKDIRQLTKLFPKRDEVLQLDPTFEPERNNGDEGIPAPIKEHTEIFAQLQKLNRVNIVVPCGAPHMFHAAMQSKGCKLTLLGKHYWNLVNREDI